jgi:hypothetical protein
MNEWWRVFFVALGVVLLLILGWFWVLQTGGASHG